jgi:hypothetical protein
VANPDEYELVIMVMMLCVVGVQREKGASREEEIGNRLQDETRKWEKSRRCKGKLESPFASPHQDADPPTSTETIYCD